MLRRPRSATRHSQRPSKRPASLSDMVMPAPRRRRAESTPARGRRRAATSRTRRRVTPSPARRTVTSNRAQQSMSTPVVLGEPANVQPVGQPGADPAAPFDPAGFADSILKLVEHKVEEVMGRVLQTSASTSSAPTTGQPPTSGASTAQINTARGSATVASTTAGSGSAADIHHNAQPSGTLASGCTPPILSTSLQASPAVPLHASVPLKIKEKIWNGEFVDFSTVFSNKSDSMSFEISPTSGISTVSAGSARKFINIEQWTDAFNIFASVYRQKYPEAAEPLAQYCATVRGISNDRGNWYMYDVKFRELKQHHPFPWESVHHQLYMSALSKRQPFRSNFRRSNGGKSPSTCNKYNRGQHCTSCNYPHRCATCFGTHPQFKHFRREQNFSGGPNAQRGHPHRSGPTAPYR